MKKIKVNRFHIVGMMFFVILFLGHNLDGSYNTFMIQNRNTTYYEKFFNSRTSNFVKIKRKGKVAYKFFSPVPFTGKAVSKYLNGNKKIEIEYKDGIKVVKTEWYENGVKKAQYTSQQRPPYNYTIKKWYPNGNKKFESFNGSEREYDECGKITQGNFLEFSASGSIEIN